MNHDQYDTPRLTPEEYGGELVWYNHLLLESKNSWGRFYQCTKVDARTRGERCQGSEQRALYHLSSTNYVGSYLYWLFHILKLLLQSIQSTIVCQCWSLPSSSPPPLILRFTLHRANGILPDVPPPATPVTPQMNTLLSAGIFRRNRMTINPIMCRVTSWELGCLLSEFIRYLLLSFL